MLSTLQIINWRKNKHASDIVVFGLMNPEKPNARKPVQLSKDFIVKQFQKTIWVPNRLTQQRMISVVVPLIRRQIFWLKPWMNNPTTLSSNPLHEISSVCL